MSKIAFILGMRRSGTTFLREIIAKHPSVEFMDFEPHELMHACEVAGIERYNGNRFVEKVVNRYRGGNDYRGAKLVFNPGINMFSWKFLNRYFPGAKLIFIKRDQEATYHSWKNEDVDSVRGITPLHIHKYFYDKFYDEVEVLSAKKKNYCLVNYESLLSDADNEMRKAWDAMGVKWISGITSMVVRPKFNAK